MWQRMVLLLIIILRISIHDISAQDCNNPITGKDAVVDEISGGLACLFCGNGAVENVIDGDLSNYVEISSLASLPGAASLISIKDIRQNYPAGRRTGFVIEPISGLLTASLLENFQIRTYLDNVLQETATFNNGSGLLKIDLLTNRNIKQRLDFVTSMPFDEVELVLTGALSGLNTVRVYYAYEEAASGCNYNCRTAINSTNFNPDPTVTDPFIGGFLNEGNLADADTTNFASATFAVVGAASLNVDIGQTINDGVEVGFAIERSGVLGLLDLDILQVITITTFNGNVQQESFTSDDLAVSAKVLVGNGINFVSFKTTLPFDEVQLEVAAAGLVITYRVYYAFLRYDTDNDGFPDCVDKCVGNDNLDADGDGTPDACDPVCTVNAGLDIAVCPPANTAQLLAAGGGQSWSAVPGNPSIATINNSGTVGGLVNEGTYLFVLTEGACTDTVAIDYVTSAIDYACNDPISGYGTIIGEGGLIGGICVLCNNPNVNNAIDGDLGNFVEYSALLSLVANTSLLSVEDTVQTYPAGTRTGFVVSVGGGLLDAAALGGFQIRTYLDGVPQETATIAGNILGAGVVPGPGNKFRLSFIATQDFDEVELVYGNVAGVLTSIRIYYAFEEPADCPNGGIEESCIEVLTTSSTYCVTIDYTLTDIFSIACVDCELDSLGNLVDDNTTNYARIGIGAAIPLNGAIAIKTRQEIPAGYEAGFAIGGGAALLDAAILERLTVETYLNGGLQEFYTADGGLIDVTLLGGTSDIGLLSFKTGSAFDEVRLVVAAPVLTNILSNLPVYYAFVRRDTDGDGTPDCYDKCCSGSDDLDLDGNGVPDACDAYADAVDDIANAPTFSPTNINVLANDDFGADGAGSVSIAYPPANGTAVVNDNGTPADPSDDYIIYTSNPGFTGEDIFRYRICDNNGSCDDATVTVTVSNFVRLQARLLLQGALLDSPDTLMRDTLRRANLLPTSEPYTGLSGFTHVNGGGGESITDASVFNDFGANSIVDWIFVELRDANNPATVVATRSALLQRDGDVVDTDGTSPLAFTQSSPGSYYIAVRHRNHLGTMTAASIALSATPAVVDFTNTNLDLWNNTPAFDGREQVIIGSKYALWAGNANIDKSVIFAGQNNDKETIFNAVDQAPGNVLKLQTYLLLGYRAEDVNLSTRTIFAGQENDVDVIFNNVDSHPVNVLKLQTFIIPEQLAN